MLHRIELDSPKTGEVDAAAQVGVQSEPDWQSSRQEPPADSAEHGEGESVDDYMAKLMQRVRAQTSEGAPSTPWTPSATPRPDPKPTQQVQETPGPDIEASAEQDDLTELSPRAVAPERLTDLAAMRQLANVSAQSAIDGHTRHQLKMAIRTKLAVMAMGLAVGGALTWFWWAMNGGDLALYSAYACFLVIVLWGIQYAVLTGRMIINRTGSVDWNSSPKSNANEKS